MHQSLPDLHNDCDDSYIIGHFASLTLPLTKLEIVLYLVMKTFNVRWRRVESDPDKDMMNCSNVTPDELAERLVNITAEHDVIIYSVLPA